MSLREDEREIVRAIRAANVTIALAGAVSPAIKLLTTGCIVGLTFADAEVAQRMADALGKADRPSKHATVVVRCFNNRVTVSTDSRPETIPEAL